MLRTTPFRCLCSRAPPGTETNPTPNRNKRLWYLLSRAKPRQLDNLMGCISIVIYILALLVVTFRENWWKSGHRNRVATENTCFFKNAEFAAGRVVQGDRLPADRHGPSGGPEGVYHQELSPVSQPLAACPCPPVKILDQSCCFHPSPATCVFFAARTRGARWCRLRCLEGAFRGFWAFWPAAEKACLVSCFFYHLIYLQLSKLAQSNTSIAVTSEAVVLLPRKACRVPLPRSLYLARVHMTLKSPVHRTPLALPHTHAVKVPLGVFHTSRLRYRFGVLS